MPAAKPGEDLAKEWETCRREVGRLLAEGNEGRYVLIKEEGIIGIRVNREDALIMGDQKFLLQPFMVHQIRERQPLARTINHPR